MKIVDTSLTAIYGLLTLLLAVSLAWFVLVKADYFYAVWHDHGGISEAIDQYGPQNRHRQGYENLSREARLEVFSKIVTAVHNQGLGLEKIVYQDPSQNVVTPLFHREEVIHLQDVARLITFFYYVVAGVVFFWLVLSARYFFASGKAFPKLESQIIGFFAIALILFVLFLILGFNTVFYRLHVWIFPEEHKWFFYYQDSLMSTLMWAPHLFRYIAYLWLAFILVFYLALLYLQTVLQQYRIRRQHAP